MSNGNAAAPERSRASNLALLIQRSLRYRNNNGKNCPPIW
jgi:hypothetical protein